MILVARTARRDVDHATASIRWWCAGGVSLRVMRWGSCLLVVAVLSTSGCASLGWRYWTKDRTYTYEREVSVDVQSEPAGATIVDETGKVVGTAPMTLVTRHPVKRTR